LGLNEIQKGLNSLLPDSIVILECREVPMEFHARFDATGKTYHYRIYNSPLPKAVGRQYGWYIRTPLDVPAMAGAAKLLKGHKDFKAFEGSGSPRPHTRRSVTQARFHRRARGVLTFEIAADGFLRYMVRNIVGTLVDVGTGKLSAEDFRGILDSRNRLKAGITAPPQGLFLVKVDYDPASYPGKGNKLKDSGSSRFQAES
jgi:tRNA pseudouridine38-40 synthase